MDMEKMIYAPIMITTLCRNAHFVREIESLKRNTWAKYTDVYIALDYPAKREHWDGYNKILEYLENGDFSCFASFQVVKRPHNFGAGINSRELQLQIQEKYDRWIAAEDDLEFSPNFIEYMDKCLMQYEDDPSVLGINGYSYPIQWELESEATAFKQFGTFSAWGCGFWREKQRKMSQDLTDRILYRQFSQCLKERKLKDFIDGRKYDYIYYALSGVQEYLYTACSDIAMGIYMGLNNQCVITPRISKVRNHGFDGSGVYCEKISQKTNEHSQTYDYGNQLIDDKLTFELRVDNSHKIENKSKLNKFLYVPVQQRMRSHILMLSYRLCGQKNTTAMFQWVKNMIKYSKNTT